MKVHLRYFALLLFVLLLSSKLTFAIPMVPFPFPCHHELENEVKKEKSLDLWERKLAFSKERAAMKSPTGVIGRWLEIQLFKNQTPRLYVIHNNDVKIISFTQARDKCLIQAKVSFLDSSDSKKKVLPKGFKFFSDADLSLTLKKRKPGLFYSWSDSNSDSIRLLPLFKSWANNKNITFVPVLARDANFAKAKKGLEKLGYNQTILVDSTVELSMRSFHKMPPAILFFAKGKLGRLPLNGVSDERTFTRELAQAWNTLLML